MTRMKIAIEKRNYGKRISALLLSRTVKKNAEQTENADSQRKIREEE